MILEILPRLGIASRVAQHDRARHRPFEGGSTRSAAQRPSVDRPPLAMVRAWVDEVMRDTDAFFTPPPTRDYEFIARMPPPRAR